MRPFKLRRWAKGVPGIFHRQGDGGRRVTGSENSHEMRIAAHEMRQASRPSERLAPLPRPALRGESSRHANFDLSPQARRGELAYRFKRGAVRDRAGP